MHLWESFHNNMMYQYFPVSSPFLIPECNAYSILRFLGILSPQHLITYILEIQLRDIFNIYFACCFLSLIPWLRSDLPPIKGQNFPVVEIPLTLPQVKLICCVIDIDQLLLLATSKSLMLILTDLKLKILCLLHN